MKKSLKNIIISALVIGSCILTVGCSRDPENIAKNMYFNNNKMTNEEVLDQNFDDTKWEEVKLNDGLEHVMFTGTDKKTGKKWIFGFNILRYENNEAAQELKKIAGGDKEDYDSVDFGEFIEIDGKRYSYVTGADEYLKYAFREQF